VSSLFTRPATPGATRVSTRVGSHDGAPLVGAIPATSSRTPPQGYNRAAQRIGRHHGTPAMAAHTIARTSASPRRAPRNVRCKMCSSASRPTPRGRVLAAEMVPARCVPPVSTRDTRVRGPTEVDPRTPPKSATQPVERRNRLRPASLRTASATARATVVRLLEVRQPGSHSTPQCPYPAPHLPRLRPGERTRLDELLPVFRDTRRFGWPAHRSNERFSCPPDMSRNRNVPTHRVYAPPSRTSSSRCARIPLRWASHLTRFREPLVRAMARSDGVAEDR
jgi:hypothetical protein